MGEVICKSLIPKDVGVMALTATATVHTRKPICKLLVLDMTDPLIGAETPSKANNEYLVKRNLGTLKETFAPLVEEVP